MAVAWHVVAAFVSFPKRRGLRAILLDAVRRCRRKHIWRACLTHHKPLGKISSSLVIVLFRAQLVVQSEKKSNVAYSWGGRVFFYGLAFNTPCVAQSGQYRIGGNALGAGSSFFPATRRPSSSVRLSVLRCCMRAFGSMPSGYLWCWAPKHAND